MRSKEDRAIKLLAAESRLPDWLQRGTNTIFIVLAWPCILVGFVYLVVFLLLNSSQGPQILHSQLGNFLRGDYFVRTMSTDALLKTLTLTDVLLTEAGQRGERRAHVVFVPKLEAQIPLWSLNELANNTLKVETITVYDGDVYLDFSRGELNILKVVLPYFSHPDYASSVNPPPEDPDAVPFTTWLSDLNVQNTTVHMAFDGFRVDLFEINVEHFELKAGKILTMTSPERGENGLAAIRVGKGQIAFNPALFSFALSDVGEYDEGLIMSGGSGTAGKLGYAYTQMSKHLNEMLCDAGKVEGCRDISSIRSEFYAMAHVLNNLNSGSPQKRMSLVIPLEDVEVDGFRWVGNTFYVPTMKSGVGDGGEMSIRSAMMNVGPTAEEMAAHEATYALKLSGGEPEETLLWAANLDLQLKVSDSILSYFLGSILDGEERLRLQAQMGGDLGRASGDIALDMPEFESYGVAVHRAALRAHMEGQNLEIRGFEADTALGAAYVKGQYAIMDGVFDLDLWAGETPDFEVDYVISDFGTKLTFGMHPTRYFKEGSLDAFAGTLSSHLKAQSDGEVIRVLMPTPIAYAFDKPYMGVESVQILPDKAQESCILSMKNGVMKSPSGLNVKLGTDEIRVKSGLVVDTNDIMASNADIAVHVTRPTKYAEVLGIYGIEMDDIDISMQYLPDSGGMNGGFYLNTANISLADAEIQRIDIGLPVKNSVLKTDRNRKFHIASNLVTVDADVTFDMSSGEISKMPFDVTVKISDIDLERIGNVDMDRMIASLSGKQVEAQRAVVIDTEELVEIQEKAGELNALIQRLGLKGTGEGVLTARGTMEDFKAQFRYVMEDVEVMEVPMSRVSFIARYEDDKAMIPAFNVWFDPSELDVEEAKTARREGKRVKRRTPDFSLGAFTYDLGANTVQFNVALQPVSPNKFKPFRDLGLPVEGTVSFDISSNIDLALLSSADLFRNHKALKSTWVEGEFNLNDVHYDGINLGNTQILMSRSNQYALFKGNLIDLLDLSGFVRTMPRFSVSMSVNFPDFDLLETLRQLGIDMQSTLDTFALREAKLSGSVGFCMKDSENMFASLIIDDVNFDVLGNALTLAQPAFATYDIVRGKAALRQFELKYRDSILKLSGEYGLDGEVSFDVNGEIDAVIAQSVMTTLQSSSETEEEATTQASSNGVYQEISQKKGGEGTSSGIVIHDSSGLFGVSLSGHGNLNSGGLIPELSIHGYIGVRNPIQIKTDLASSAFVLRKGFLILDNKGARCDGSRICMYTPEEQPFEFGVNGEWVDLSLLATSKGHFDVLLSGNVNVSAAQLFVKDLTEARGNLGLEVAVKGDLPLKNLANADVMSHIKVSGKLEVMDPVTVEMRALSDPITLDDGLLMITEGSDCGGKQCITIPQGRAFQGNLMGGSYKIFGTVYRDSLTPKSGNLSIFANNVSFRMKDELFVTVSPDIQITAKDFTNWETVKVSGDIDIAEARYTKDFDDGSSNFIRDQILSMFIDSKKRVDTYSPSFLRKWPFLGKINLDVGILAENTINVDVKIATAVVELELGSQLRVGGTVKAFAPSGIFSISEGVFSLRDNDFEFQNGAQIAFSGSLDGKIDITATTEISTDSNAFGAVTGNTERDKRKRIASSSASSSDLYSITLTVGGSVFKPVWSFESSPYLSDTNVYALILTGRTIEDFSGNDVAMESLLSPLFSSQLDTYIDADEFNFVFTEGAAQFVYVKQLSKSLHVAAGVSIRGSDGNEQALSAEYRIYDWDKKYLYLELTGQNTSDEEGRAPTFKLGGTLHYHLPID